MGIEAADLDYNDLGVGSAGHRRVVEAGCFDGHRAHSGSETLLATMIQVIA